MMHLRNRLAGIAGAVAVGSMVVAPGFVPRATAQEMTDAQDPPGRVGRVARIAGTVSFRTADEASWERATPNYPVTSNNAFWTEPAATAEFDIGSAYIALDQSTEFDIDTLDDQRLAATAVQGAMYLRVGTLLPGESYQIATPRGVVTIAKAGRYEIVAGDTERPTQVTVVEGTAEIDIGSGALVVAAHQTAQVTGSDDFRAGIVTAPNDAFLAARLAAERAPPPAPAPVAIPAVQRAAPPPAVAQMTGGAALMSIGTWAQSRQYDRIWYPPVQADWVPYRHGHWGYVAPWGWTWIDDAPWGFAPFHYGRWVQDGPRWGWVPIQPGVSASVAARPTYAPALVSFVGIAVSAAVEANRPAPRPGFPPGPRPAPGFGGSVGWVPLGPQEVYRPPYKVSTNYVRNVNVTNVRNVTNITNVTVNNNAPIDTLANRRAATVVPANVLTASQPVAARVERVAPEAIAQARPVRAAPVQPTTATAGVTPVVAQRLNLKPEAGAAPPVRPAAPGPVPEARTGGKQIVPKAAVMAPQPAPPGSQAPAPVTPRPGTPQRPGIAAGQLQAPQAVTLPKLRPMPANARTPAPVMPAPASPAPTQPPAAQAPAAPASTAPATPARPAPTPATPAPTAPIPATPTPPPQARPAAPTPQGHPPAAETKPPESRRSPPTAPQSAQPAAPRPAPPKPEPEPAPAPRP